MAQLSDDELAEQIWNYHLVNHSLEPSDIIFVLGSHDLRVAHRAAELFLAGLAPLLVFSGGLGNWTSGVFQKSEAETFADEAIRLGVPAKHIIIENRSTNTGENIRFTYSILKERGIRVTKMILVQKPYMERRTYATFMKQWIQPENDPLVQIFVTSPQISFKDYPNGADVSRDVLFNAMVGDLQRILYYPAQGFQIEQVVPEGVWEACEELVRRGYNKHVLQPKK